MMRRIYMDYAATTPVDEAVMAEMSPYFSTIYGNPSSVHGAGEEAQGGVVAARRAVAELLNCEPSEIAFTSGASEGNNAVIRSFAGASSTRRIGGKPHIIVSAIEHDCVLESVKAAEKSEEVELTIISVSHDGLVNPDDVVSAIRPNTVLVSVMYVNNETGIIQRIPRIGKILKEINSERARKIYFHTDAVQAANYFDCDVHYLGVDLMTLSSHKMYGPKGAGALFVKNGTPFDPLMKGGEQEFHRRAGTHNVPGIVGMGKSVSEAIKRRREIPEIISLRDRLIDGILGTIPEVALAGRRDYRAPNNANIIFRGCSGEDILRRLSALGVYVSTGSACAAKSADPSHVLTAMGFSADEARSAIRFSIGRHTTREDVDYVLQVLPDIVAKLREKNGAIGGGVASRESVSNKVAYPEITVSKSGYQTVMDSRLPVPPVEYDGVSGNYGESSGAGTEFSEFPVSTMLEEHQEKIIEVERPAANASFGKIDEDSYSSAVTPEVKFYGDEEIDRAGLPADLGCEKNRKVGEEDAE